MPAFLREQRPYRNGLHDISKDRYLSRAWHDLEKERLWSRVWQLACREEHLPAVGDYVVYDIADQSYIIVRTQPDVIQAYPNACLHRGGAAQVLRRPLWRDPLPVPRVRMALGWLAPADPGRMGFSSPA